MKRNIYKYDINYGRGYGVEGMFVATEEDIKVICLQEINFGEICGKHSEVTVTFEPNDFKIVPANGETVDWFIDNVGGTGHDPRDYIHCRYCGSEWYVGAYATRADGSTCEECERFRKLREG